MTAIDFLVIFVLHRVSFPVSIQRCFFALLLEVISLEHTQGTFGELIIALKSSGSCRAMSTPYNKEALAIAVAQTRAGLTYPHKAFLGLLVLSLFRSGYPRFSIREV